MIELFQAGGPVMLPLLACSLLTVAVILERSWYWWRLERGREALLGRIVAAADEARGWRRAGLMRIAAEREAAQLGRHLGILGTMVSLAPLLGIFGTVLGIIDSFQFLDATVDSSPAMARRGLAQALLTTAFGLAIAMLSLIALKIFQSKVMRTRHAIEIRCSEEELASGPPPASEP